MDRVFRQDHRPISGVSLVAVAIREFSPGRRHTGIFYRVNATDDIEFLHLAWHCDLQRDRAFSGEYYWVEPKINKARLRQLAAICDDIAAENFPNRIPYASGSPVGAFDEKTKAFLLGPTRAGLTCASFVLAVFERAELRLVRYSGWPAPDLVDVEFQQFVVDNLRGRHGVSKEHIEAVEREVGTSVRYRPEQVAGAAAIRMYRPVKYPYAKALGNDIVRFLRGEPELGEFQLTIWDRLLKRIGFA